jgi:hypothetical protein
MVVQARERLPYERALRVIGRHLDAEPAYHVSVLESTDGFTVRSQAVRHRAKARIELFSWDTLHNIDVLHTAGRYAPGRRQRHRGLWSNLPTGHQDFFRALGYELDQEGAASVTIDELPEGLSVTYMQPTHHEPGFWVKCHRVFERGDIEQLLGEAQSRRGTSVASAS